jgi:hypothetical protein
MSLGNQATGGVVYKQQVLVYLVIPMKAEIFIAQVLGVRLEGNF